MSNNTSNNTNNNSSTNSDDGSAPNSLNPSSLLSLAGFMGAANMRGTNMSGMPGLNHMRGNMSVMNQAGTSMAMNSVGVNNASNVPGTWMTSGGGGNTGVIGGDNSGGNNSMVSPGNMMWGDMADSLMERGRSKNWTYEETMELITTYTSDEWQNKFSSEKKNHRAIWAEMAEVLKKREGVTGDEARQRLNNLKALYNRIRRQLIAGEISSPQWEYWDSLHHFLTRPSQYHGFGFPRSSPPIRTSHTPQMHPPHTPTGPTYPSMHHMQLPRQMHHGRMGHMMPPQMVMQQRPHDMQSSMPFNCPPFKVKSEAFDEGVVGGDASSGVGGAGGNPANVGDYTRSGEAKGPALRTGRAFSYDTASDDGLPGGVSQRGLVQGDDGSDSTAGMSGIEAVVAAAAAAAAAVTGDDGGVGGSGGEGGVDTHGNGRAGSNGGMSGCGGMPSPQHQLPPPTNKPESYQLRHNNHLSLVLNQLAEDEAFMDVTLTAEGRPIKAHKSVLSAVSPYFSGVLRANPCPHPIIIMPRDIKFPELSNIIMYIYKGEMTVSAEDLPSLLKTAELLRITGLSPGETPNSTGGVNLPQNGSQLTSPGPDRCPSTAFRATLNSCNITTATGSSSSVNNTSRFNNLSSSKITSDSCLTSTNTTTTCVDTSTVHISDNGETLSPALTMESPTNVQTMINPSDFMDIDMTCVKEEMNSDDEQDDAESSTSKEVTTPPPIENPLSLRKDDTDNVPGLEASDDPSSSVISPRTDPPSLETNTEESTSDAERKQNSLKTLAKLASLDTPTNLSPSDSSSPIDNNIESTSITDPTPNVCPYCSEFILGSNSSSHLSSKHAFKPAFVCSTCSRIYTKKIVYEQHRKMCKNGS